MDEIPESPPAEPVEPQPTQPAPTPQWSLARVGGFIGLGVIYLLMFVPGGELRSFAVMGLFAIPFMVLVVLAYSTESKQPWTRFLTFGYWMVLTTGIGFLTMALTIAVIALPTLGPITNLEAAQAQAAGKDFSLEQGLRILACIVGLLGAGVVSVLCFFPAIRRRFAQVLDIDAHSFVHATALATVFAIMLMSMIPLLAVGDPPALPLLQLQMNGANPPDAGEQLRTTFYSFVWALPSVFLAVGYPLRRSTLREAQQRLGLVRPTLLQLALSVVTIGGLLLVMPALGYGIEFVWKALGWPLTDEESIKQLFGFTAGPVGAIVAAIVAGLGEELVFRGVLQPRLGILLPALMFAAVHALQYNFDALLQVLFLGVVFGLIRKRTNTTVSAIIHGGYDFVLLLAMNKP